MAQSGSATTATATPRRGTCPLADNIPAGYADRGTWYDFFAGKAATNYGVTWGPGFATFQYPNANRALDHLVSRPHTRHDATQRLRRAGGLLHHPRRPSRRRRRARLPHRYAGCSARSGSQRGGQIPVEQDLLRDPHRDPGSRVQHRRFTVLPGHASVLRRHRQPVIPDSTWQLLADLEPGVLRQHDHGQRQYVAFPDRGEAPLPLPLPERLPIPRADPGLRQHSWCRGLADRQRGRFPRGSGQPHCRQRQPAAAGSGRTRRCDRRLHQRPGGQLRARQRRPRRAVRRGCRSIHFRVADPATTGQIMQFRVVPAVAPDPDHATAFPGAAGDHAAACGNGHTPARADREDGHGLRR